MKILINNTKVLGIFVAISLVSIPTLGFLWLMLEEEGNLVLTVTIAIIFAAFIFLLYFFAGRFLIKSTEILFKDFLSVLVAIAIIVVGLAIGFEKIMFFAYPYFLIIPFYGSQEIGLIISIAISAIMIIIGMRAKNKFVGVKVSFIVSIMVIMLGALTNSGL